MLTYNYACQSKSRRHEKNHILDGTMKGTNKIWTKVRFAAHSLPEKDLLMYVFFKSLFSKCLEF